MLQWFRRIVQLGALAFLVFVPALNYGAILQQQYGKNAYHTISLMGSGFDQAVFYLFSAAANFIPDLAVKSTAVVGGFGSFSIFGVTFLDPVVALETLVRAPGAWALILAGSVLSVLIAVLLGRVFCGWMCPVNTILEGLDTLRKRALPRLGLRPIDISLPRWFKWALLFIGIGTAALGDLALWAHLLPHVQIGRDVFSLMIFGGATAGIWIFAVIVLAELLFSRRAWCRSLCPTGALLGGLGVFASLRVRKEDAPCLSDCAACARACPMALDPSRAISQAECMNCAACISACPASLLSLLPKTPYRERFAEVNPMYWRITVAVLVLAGGLLTYSLAAAHHMRGLPHYGYTESYPQIPTKETHSRMGKFDVVVVTYFFEGVRRERAETPDDVQFYIGLRNTETHQSYTGPLSIELWGSGRRIAAFEHTRPFEEAVYRFRQAVPGPGSYELRLAAGGLRGRVSVAIEGKPVSSTPYILGGLAALFAVLFLLNRRRRFGRGRKTHVASGA